MCASRAEAAHRPLQFSVAIDVTGLMREVVRPRIPVLQLHVTQRGLRANQQLDCAHVQTRRVGTRGGGFLQERGRAPLFENHQRVAEIGCLGLRQTDQAMQGLVDLHIAGHIEHRSAGPECGVPGGEAVGRRPDGARHQVRFERGPMISHQSGQISEENTRANQFLFESCSCRTSVDMRHAAGKLRAIREQCGEFGRGAGRSRGRTQSIIVGAKRAQVDAFELFRVERPFEPFDVEIECLAAQIDDPTRLVAGFEERLERRPLESGRSIGGGFFQRACHRSHVSRPSLPFAARSGGSSRRRIPSAAPSRAAR